MRHIDLRKKVRSLARDFNETIFRQTDITLFLNEGIDRFVQVLPELSNIPYLVADEDAVEIIPREYVHLLCNYCVSRLFSQDERHYEASTFMNEFEVKLSEFHEKVLNGEIILIDPASGEQIETNLPVDYVVDNYYFGTGEFDSEDIDEGVEGVK